MTPEPDNFEWNLHVIGRGLLASYLLLIATIFSISGCTSPLISSNIAIEANNNTVPLSGL